MKTFDYTLIQKIKSLMQKIEIVYGTKDTVKDKVTASESTSNALKTASETKISDYNAKDLQTLTFLNTRYTTLENMLSGIYNPNRNYPPDEVIPVEFPITGVPDGVMVKKLYYYETGGLKFLYGCSPTHGLLFNNNPDNTDIFQYITKKVNANFDTYKTTCIKRDSKSGYFFIGGGSKLYVSTNHLMTTFRSVTKSNINTQFGEIFDIEIVPVSGRNSYIFIATTTGLYVSTDNGFTFLNADPKSSLRNCRISKLLYNTNTNKLFVGTLGNYLFARIYTDLSGLFTQYTGNNGIRNAFINDITIDKLNATPKIILSTDYSISYADLNTMNFNNSIDKTNLQTLPTNTFLSCVVHEGVLVLSTSVGLIKIMSPYSGSRNIIVLGTNDGLNSYICFDILVHANEFFSIAHDNGISYNKNIGLA